jgi:hypothetical protein
MIDPALWGVGREASAWSSELVVEVDAGGEAEQAAADSGVQVRQGAGAVRSRLIRSFIVQKTLSMRWRIVESRSCWRDFGSSARRGWMIAIPSSAAVSRAHGWRSPCRKRPC